MHQEKAASCTACCLCCRTYTPSASAIAGWKNHPRITTLRSLWIQSSCLCSFAGACLSCPHFCKTSAGWRKWGREEELEPVVCSIAPRGISEPGEEASPLQTVPSPLLSSSEPRWWCLATLWWQPRRKQKGEALSLEPGLFVCPSLWVCIAWL